MGIQAWYLVAGAIAIGISAAFTLIPAVRDIEQYASARKPEAKLAELAPAKAT